MILAIIVPIIVNVLLYLVITSIFGTPSDTIYDTIFMMVLANLIIGIGAFIRPFNNDGRLSPLQMVAVLRLPADDNAAFVMAKSALDKHHNISNPKQISIFKFPSLIRNFIFILVGIIGIVISIIYYI